MADNQWRTAVAGYIDGEPHVRGYNLLEMTKELTFAEAIFLVLKGELPDAKERKLFEAILVTGVDHGLGMPSVTAARNVISGGNPINAGIAAGILAIGDAHGGAIEQCAKLLYDFTKRYADDIATSAGLIALRARQERSRIPGYGHAVYTTDPRAKTLIDIAKTTGHNGGYIALALAIEAELEKLHGKKICLNVDGAIAALLCELRFDWRVGKGIFIISRTAGLTAHVVEEMAREAPFRRIPPEEITYDGLAKRKITSTKHQKSNNIQI